MHTHEHTCTESTETDRAHEYTQNTGNSTGVLATSGTHSYTEQNIGYREQMSVKNIINSNPAICVTFDNNIQNLITSPRAKGLGNLKELSGIVSEAGSAGRK